MSKHACDLHPEIEIPDKFSRCWKCVDQLLYARGLRERPKWFDEEEVLNPDELGVEDWVDEPITHFSIQTAPIVVTGLDGECFFCKSIKDKFKSLGIKSYNPDYMDLDTAGQNLMEEYYDHYSKTGHILS